THHSTISRLESRSSTHIAWPKTIRYETRDARRETRDERQEIPSPVSYLRSRVSCPVSPISCLKRLALSRLESRRSTHIAWPKTIWYETRDARQEMRDKRYRLQSRISGLVSPVPCLLSLV